MKIQFIGVGSAFTTPEYYQSNLVVSAENGKMIMIDCGTDARFSLSDAGISNEHIDAIYLSHLHSDHIGGMEWMGFTTYFNTKKDRPRLFMEENLIIEMWNHSLKGGLGTIQGKRMHLTDFFECTSVFRNGSFVWENIRFSLVPMKHILNGYRELFSYGLFIQENKKEAPCIFFSTDTQFDPKMIEKVSKKADIIFHDCETSPFRSNVHAHYNDLATLPEKIKQKIWLYHYQPHPAPDPKADGFLGFVPKGKIFRF